MESDSHFGWELTKQTDAFVLVAWMNFILEDLELISSIPFQRISHGLTECPRRSPAWRRTEIRRGRRTGSSEGEWLQGDTSVWWMGWVYNHSWGGGGNSRTHRSGPPACKLPIFMSTQPSHWPEEWSSGKVYLLRRQVLLKNYFIHQNLCILHNTTNLFHNTNVIFNYQPDN